MTCIIAYNGDDGKQYMIADKAIGGDIYFSEYTNSKIIKKKIGNKDCVIGFSGNIRQQELIKYSFDFPVPDKNVSFHEYWVNRCAPLFLKLFKYNECVSKSEDWSMCPEILINYDAGIYRTTNFYGLVICNSFWSIGSGSVIARGAMEAFIIDSNRYNKRQPEFILRDTMDIVCKTVVGIGFGYDLEVL